MMKRMDVRVKRTYKQLFSSLTQLLAVKSFEEITVSEICDKAHVHRATFYKHFKDKYEFLNFCFESSLQEIKLADLDSPTPENVKDSFMFFIREAMEYVRKNKLIFSMICSDIYSISLGFTFVKAVNTFCLEKIQSVLPNISKDKAEIMSSFYSCAFIGIVLWYANREDDYPLDDIYAFLEHRVDELCSFYQDNMYSTD